ncbi:hypothetical protein IE4872_PD02273 (plasmid) [Rhizobium gallicum]|uniref:Uncharacterized protein n=1 Tax=Rhizobium gallicum TaxID=56730 RepID=A0A1L5NXZ3_9HYPH|nr:hypothetical protein IE4872_PD02273 [Rhizobium gallicum]
MLRFLLEGGVHPHLARILRLHRPGLDRLAARKLVFADGNYLSGEGKSSVLIARW